MRRRQAFSRPTATFEEQSVLFQEYRAIGYDGLQLKWGQYASYLNEPERFLEAWGHLPGVGSALIAGGSLDEEGVQRLRSIYRFASSIGTELIVFCHGTSRADVTSGDLRRYAEQLSRLGAEAQQHGLKLSLHHHYDNPVMYRDDFDVFFDKIVEGTVGLTVDTAHLVKSGVTDVAELIRSFRGIIDNFHLKDFERGGWKVLGQGGIDFVPIFDAIRDIGYEGWVSADEESGDELLAGMRTCFEFMRHGLVMVS